MKAALSTNMSFIRTQITHYHYILFINLYTNRQYYFNLPRQAYMKTYSHNSYKHQHNLSKKIIKTLIDNSNSSEDSKPTPSSPRPFQKVYLSKDIRSSCQKSSRSDSIAIVDDYSYSIREQGTLDDYQIADKIIEAIQLLNYGRKGRNEVQSQFLNLVGQFIEMDDIFPESKHEIGDILLSDGIFHEMWGKILRLLKKIQFFPIYYETYSHMLRKNISSFQSTFNLYDSNSQISQSRSIDPLKPLSQIGSREQSSHKQQVEEEQMIKGVVEAKQIKIRTQEQSLSECVDWNSNYYSNKERLRLIGHVAINKRRIQAEMVCYLLELKQAFKWKEIQIAKVIEFYSSNKKELVIVEAHVQHYNVLLNKKVIDVKPRLLMGLYGYVNFVQVLRIKQQYQIEAFLLQDQNMNLAIWLKANGHLDEHVL